MSAVDEFLIPVHLAADGAADSSDGSERIEPLDQVDILPDRFFEDIWS